MNNLEAPKPTIERARDALSSVCSKIGGMAMSGMEGIKNMVSPSNREDRWKNIMESK